MSLDSGVSLGQLLLALGVMLTTGGIAWGALIQRVKTLEKEVEALSGFATTLAVMQSELTHIKRGIDNITGSWLFKEPPSYVAMDRPTNDMRRPK